MRSSSVILCLAAMAAHFTHVAHAQKYDLTAVPVPANRSLHTLYAFYVFSHEEAPARPEGRPFVMFSDFTGAPAGHRGIQLSIMKYTDFWQLINPQKFCCTYDDTLSGICEDKDQLLVQKAPNTDYADVDVFSTAVSFSGTATPDVKQTFHRTGVYILVYSNCGDFADASVSGLVTVRNAYGFLPGNEYHKMPFYGCLTWVYVVLAVAWMVLSLRWWKELSNIQNCITAVIFFGLVEAFLWYIFFNDWNKNGVSRKMLFVLSILSSVIKSIFSYMLVLVAALGWGVTKPYLDRQVILKIQGVCFLYIVLDFIRESVLSFRHSHSLNLVFVLLCLLPVYLLNGGIFYWIFTALSSLMETLRERRQVEKLALFIHLRKTLICAVGVATGTLLFQIFKLSQSLTIGWKYQMQFNHGWKYQWFYVDGVSHILFLVVLAAMMYLWAPHKFSQKFAYSQQVDPAEFSWDEEGRLDDDADHDDPFGATAHRDASDDKDSTMKATAVAPVETIGA